MSFEATVKRGQRNKIIDVKYTLRPDFSFVGEVKKANARSKMVKETFSGQGRLPLSTQGKTSKK